MNTVSLDSKEHEPRAAGLFRRRLGKLTGCYLICCVLVMCLVFLVSGSTYLLSALIAGLVCCFAGILAHLVAEFPQGDMFLTGRLLGSSLVRAGIPLVLLVVLKLTNSPLMNTGIAYFIVGFYLAGLLADLFINIKRFQVLANVSPGKYDGPTE